MGATKLLLLTKQNPLGKITTTVFDAASRPVAQIDPLLHRTTFGFDAVGNQVKAQNALNNTTTTIFDSLNRPYVTIDALANRTTVPTTTKYIWDDQNYLAEADGSDTINVVYTNEPEQYGNLVSTRISGSTSYHHFDAIGSTRQLTNAAGARSATG